MILETPPLKEVSSSRLHDIVQQHLRALKAMAYEPSGPSWSWRSTQCSNGKDTHRILLKYLTTRNYCNLRAQASEAPVSTRKGPKNPSSAKHIASFTANADKIATNCVVLYVCTRFQSPHDKDNKLCISQETMQISRLSYCMSKLKSYSCIFHSYPLFLRQPILHSATGVTSNAVLMTCLVLVNGSTIEARVRLPRSIASVKVSSTLFPQNKIGVSAISPCLVRPIMETLRTFHLLIPTLTW